MLYALDTEFMEDGKTIELISIGLVAQDGRELYVQRCEAPIDADRRVFYNKEYPGPNAWVQQHVLPHLEHPYCLTPCETPGCPWLHESDLADCLLGFVGDDPSPSFLGYYSAYDWVVLCQLFGPMIALPPGWPMYCRDLRPWLDDQGLEHVTQPDNMPHHALSDARWILQMWQQYKDP